MMQEAKMQDNHSLAQMEFLYKKFYVRLHRYALTFLGDEDEATDVVGEVFLQIWESWQVAQPSMKGRTSPPIFTLG